MSHRHRHLRRLEHNWSQFPLFLITTNTYLRRPILANPTTASILINEWQSSPTRHGWNIARQVIMPDHVHFFCAPKRNSKTLELFMCKWKEWTSKRITRELNLKPSIWQQEFHDHILRSESSAAEKWDYLYMNPVRAGLVTTPEDWPYSGEIISTHEL